MNRVLKALATNRPTTFRVHMAGENWLSDIHTIQENGFLCKVLAAQA